MALRVTFLKNILEVPQHFKQGGIGRTFHHEAHSYFVPIPEVPISLHDSDSYVLVPEDSSLLMAFKPNASDLTYENIVLNLNNINARFRHNIMILLDETRVESQRIYHRLAEKDLISMSDQALQSAREAHIKYFKNTFIMSGLGVLSVEKFSLPVDKIRDNFKEASLKLSNIIFNKIPFDMVKQKWAVMKEKLPEWQISLANKLQVIQDFVNKKVFKEKKTEGEDCK